MQAAPAHGRRAALTLLPTPGRPVHAARIDLEPRSRRRSNLYEAIPHRRTDDIARFHRVLHGPRRPPEASMQPTAPTRTPVERTQTDVMFRRTASTTSAGTSAMP